MSAARRIVKRFVKDESGWTMTLALIMILLISVMGAGLLTFVSRDLIAVTEVNQGQKAFEVADAGVQAAKRQLTADCAGNLTCIEHYDDIAGEVLGAEDYQWSWVKDGVTLNDLDGSATISDSVTVTIDYRYGTDDFLVISESSYGDAPASKRKIEAILKGVSGSAGGDGTGHPLYYTPSDIKIEAPFTLSAISLFTQGDILVEGATSPDGFRADYQSSNSGTLTVPNPKDELKDWDSRNFPAGTSGNWNTVGRRGQTGWASPCNRDNRACEQPGFAAEGKICGFSTGSSTATCDASSTSVADGVYGYDSTTGPRISGSPDVCPTSSDPTNPNSRGTNLTFCAKDPVDKNPNDAGTITYPFPRPEPKNLRLKRLAQEQGKYYKGTSPPWNTLFAGNTANSIVFIDAEGSQLDFSTANSQNNKGILVVWCGDLRLNAKYQGIILNLQGDPSSWTPPITDPDELNSTSTCDDNKGVFRNNGQDFSGWLYAQGGNSSKAGIELGPNPVTGEGSRVSFLPGASWSFFNDAFSGTPPTAFVAQGWRELYQ